MNIRKHNIPAHIDIENDVVAKKDGLLTFTLRINAGNITDYNRPETINPATKYKSAERDPLEQFTISPDLGKRSRGNSIRDDNGDGDGG